MPRVSVIMPAFNHEEFVGESIQSVLDQTYQDFEILVTDDGSSDGTVEKIGRVNDPRLRLFTFRTNQGACAAMNNSIRHAEGAVLAVLNSDDVWEPTKLEVQLEFLEGHPEIGAVFTKPSFISEWGATMAPEDYKHHRVFEVGNRSRFEWLNRFFYRGNCLCHPSVLIRRTCSERVGLYDERLANLPDLDMWVRLCLEFEIYVIEERLVRFRVRAEDANQSADRLETQIRGRFEFKQILDHYLELDAAAFARVFPEAARLGVIDAESIPYLLGRLALGTWHSTGQLWGLEQLFDVLGNREKAKVAEDRFGFRYADLHRLTGVHDPFKVSPAALRLRQALGRAPARLQDLAEFVRRFFQP